MPRNLLGYGENPIDPEWPNGARIAVSFVLNYEEGAEHHIMNGDDRSEAHIWEKCAPNTERINGRHLVGESDFEYGSRVGCWRILRTMKEFGFPMTVYGVAQAFQKNPEFAKACVRDGHEIANHGLRWLSWEYSSDEEQLEMIKTSLQMIKDVSGVAPVGTYIGRGNTKTACIAAQAHKEIGFPLLWESDINNDDVPFWVDLPQEKELPDSEKEGMLMIPYAYNTNDLKFVEQNSGAGFPGAFSYKDYLISEFNQLYHEGGRMLNIPLHARVIGKPGRTQALREFMEYISKKEGVWVCTRKDIATHFRAKFPYVPGELAVKK